MIFDVNHFLFVIDKLEGVRTVAVHVTESVGDSTVAEQKHCLMRSFGTQAYEIPEHVGILKHILLCNVMKKKPSPRTLDKLY